MGSLVHWEGGEGGGGVRKVDGEEGWGRLIWMKGNEMLTGGFLGIVGQELRDKQWSKILSLAPMHI